MQKSPGTKGLEFVFPSVPATLFMWIFDGLRFKWFMTCKKIHVLIFKLVEKVKSRVLDIQLWMDITIIECIFLSIRQHYNSFLVFTFIRYQLVFDWCSRFRNSTQYLDVNFKRAGQFEFGLNLEVLKGFLKKLLEIYEFEIEIRIWDWICV